MLVKQFFIEGLAHSSYIIAGDSICAVVDPARDVKMYLDAAAAMDLKITHIIQTHLHADFISGHKDLADITGADIYIPKSAKAKFPHIPVSEPDSFKLEDISFTVLETPGHTPEHVSYVVRDNSRGADPAGVFCGDTLFVGDVGRPDLFPGIAHELASKLFDSLHKKIMTLPDDCAVYPAHGAGSLCGRSIGAMRTGTIGYERKFNRPLLIKERGEFIKSLTAGMPPAPDHFSRCSAANAAGPELVSNIPPPEKLSPAGFREKALSEDNTVLDIRGYSEFSAQHVPGAWNIDLNGNFSTFAGWILPPDKNIFLVSDKPSDINTACRLLRRVGLDKTRGWLAGSMSAWAMEGYDSLHINIVSSAQLHKMISKGSPVQLVDVRSSGEFEINHIKGAVNIPAPELRTEYKNLDPSIPAVCICSTGVRAGMGAAILKANNFKSVYNAAGGMTGYSLAGFAPACPVCSIPYGVRGKQENF